MLVCKFEINWSTNKNLRALTTYLGRMDELTNGRPAFPYPPLRFAGAGDNNIICSEMDHLACFEECLLESVEE